MTCYGGTELANSFRTVRKNTIIIAEEIPEDKYGFRAAPDTRTVAQTLVHIAMTPGMALELHEIKKLNTLEGFDFPTFIGKMIAEEHKPRTKAEIVTMLKDGGDRFATFVEGCSEEFLSERVEFPRQMNAPSKSRFEMLLGTKEHEMHHRAQLMLMERMLGMVPHLTRDFQARMTAAQASTAKP
jgi:DinB superfamily